MINLIRVVNLTSTVALGDHNLIRKCPKKSGGKIQTGKISLAYGHGCPTACVFGARPCASDPAQPPKLLNLVATTLGWGIWIRGPDIDSWHRCDFSAIQILTVPLSFSWSQLSLSYPPLLCMHNCSAGCVFDTAGAPHLRNLESYGTY